MSVAGQVAVRDEDGQVFLVAAVGLDRLRWLSVMLTMVPMRPQARVLELSTDADFGYSAVILADATCGGSVVSVHWSPEVTRRARQAQRFGRRARQVSFHTGQLREGWPDGAPYDLIVSLCPFGWLPQAWLDQCRPGAAIVHPLELDRPHQASFLRIEVDEQHRPARPDVLQLISPDPRYWYCLPAHSVELHHNPAEGGYDIQLSLWPIPDTGDGQYR
jgi:protein-L-isoaspartate O-methyltransferase